MSHNLSSDFCNNCYAAQIGVLDSCVGDEASPDSDIAVLLRSRNRRGSSSFGDWGKPEGWLGAKVELVTKAAPKPHIGRRIMSEVAMP
jgi:predicted nucleotidyltransferase